jgi:hypothetical protein
VSSGPSHGQRSNEIDIVGLPYAAEGIRGAMVFAGVWRVPEWPLERPLPTPSGNERKRVLGVPGCPTGGYRVRATRDSRHTLMISLGLWPAATGIVAVSFESFGAALVLFGIAGLLIRFA